MPPCPTAEINHPHPIQDEIAEQIDLGLQERADLGRLCRRVQGPVQQTTSIDLFVGHNHSV